MIGTAFWPQRQWLRYFLTAVLLPAGNKKRYSGEVRPFSFKSSEEVLAPLFGTWEWLRSSGIGRQGRTPASAGYVHTLQLNPDGTLTIFKNEAVFATGNYWSVPRPENTAEQKVILKYAYTNNSKREGKFTFKFIGTNTLCFTEEAIFRYNQHLFLRHLSN